MGTSEVSAGNNRRLRLAILAALAAYAAALYALGWMYPQRYQLTFEAYYYGARAFEATGNPYDSEYIASIAGRDDVYPYVKLPLTVHLVRPFAWFDYVTAKRIYLLFKIAALGYLLWLWSTRFLKPPIDVKFLFLCLLGFNFALFWDFWSGNVSLFTFAVLWTAFYAFVRNRLGWFTTFTVLAAFWKLTPIFFLSMLVFLPGKHKWRWLVIGAVAFGAMQGASLLLYPDLTEAFFASAEKMRGVQSEHWAGQVKDTGKINRAGSVSSYMLFAEAHNLAEQAIAHKLPETLAMILYVIAVVCVFVATIYCARRQLPARNADTRAMLVMMSCLVYLLILPRALVYEYVLALLPAYLIARRFPKVDPVYVLLALMLLVPIVGRPAGVNWFITNFADFTPLFLALVVWLAGLYSMRPQFHHPGSPVQVASGRWRGANDWFDR